MSSANSAAEVSWVQTIGARSSASIADHLGAVGDLVAAAGQLLALLDGDAEVEADVDDRVEVAGEADEGRVEPVEVARAASASSSRAGSVVTNTTSTCSRSASSSRVMRRGEAGHHGLADVGAVGVAEEDQRQPLVGVGRERVRLAVGVGQRRRRGRRRAGRARCRATSPSSGVSAPQPVEQRQRAGRPPSDAARAASARRTPSARSSVEGRAGRRSPAARSSGWSSRARTNAEPTITPSAYDATSAAWSPLLTPRPTADRQVGRRAGAGDQRPGEVAGRGAGAGDAHDGGGVDEARGRRRWSSRSARRWSTARPGRPCRGRARRRRRSTPGRCRGSGRA